eukprot:5885523-Pyramimonas_sp.AAC.1
MYTFHVAIHLAEQVVAKGNPRAYWTYPDEAENRFVKTVAMPLHGGGTSYVRFLEKVIPAILWSQGAFERNLA